MVSNSAKPASMPKILYFIVSEVMAYLFFCKNNESLKLHNSVTKASGSMKMGKVGCKRHVDNENGIKFRKTCIHAQDIGFYNKPSLWHIQFFEKTPIV